MMPVEAERIKEYHLVENKLKNQKPWQIYTIHANIRTKETTTQIRIQHTRNGNKAWHILSSIQNGGAVHILKTLPLLIVPEIIVIMPGTDHNHHNQVQTNKKIWSSSM